MNVSGFQPNVLNFDAPKMKKRTVKSVEDGDLVWTRPRQVYSQTKMSSSPLQGTSFAKQMIGYDQEISQVAELFFSRSNLDEIHRLIRFNVYSNTVKKHLIDNQDDLEILIMMKGIYINFAKNYLRNVDPSLFTKEIQRLNALLISDITPKLISSIEGYYGYLRDSERPYKLQPTPVSASTKGETINRSASDVIFGDDPFYEANKLDELI